MGIEWKDVVEFSSALLTPVIAVVTTYIAVQQYRIEKKQFIHDRYDRRLSIYRSVMSLIGSVVQSADASWPEVQDFVRSTAEAPFLFGKDKNIPEYLEEIRKRALKLQHLNKLYNLYSQKPFAGYDNDSVVDSQTAELKWFLDQLSAAEKLFQKHLNIG